MPGSLHTDSYLLIEVRNFNAIAANTLISMNIRDIVNPTTNAVYYETGILTATETLNVFIYKNFAWNEKGIFVLPAATPAVSAAAITIPAGNAASPLSATLTNAYPVGALTLSEFDTFGV